MMSSSRRAGLSEGKGAVPVDLYLKTLLAHRLFDDIHLAAQNAGQALFEIAQTAEIIEPWRREILAEAYRHIDIVRGSLPSCDRAEQGYAQHASGAELRFMRLQRSYDMVALHGTIILHNSHVWAIASWSRFTNNTIASTRNTPATRYTPDVSAMAAPSP